MVARLNGTFDGSIHCGLSPPGSTVFTPDGGPGSPPEAGWLGAGSAVPGWEPPGIGVDVGTGGGGGGGAGDPTLKAPASRTAPKSLTHELPVWPTPMTRYEGFRIFALCPGEFIQPVTTLLAEYPRAMFSPAPVG